MPKLKLGRLEVNGDDLVPPEPCAERKHSVTGSKIQDASRFLREIRETPRPLDVPLTRERALLSRHCARVGERPYTGRYPHEAKAHRIERSSGKLP
jgi:hypothetical protein